MLPFLWYGVCTSSHCSLEYVEDKSLLISSSHDGCVRLWNTNGQFVGVYTRTHVHMVHAAGMLSCCTIVRVRVLELWCSVCTGGPVDRKGHTMCSDSDIWQVWVYFIIDTSNLYSCICRHLWPIWTLESVKSLNLPASQTAEWDHIWHPGPTKHWHQRCKHQQGDSRQWPDRCWH